MKQKKRAIGIAVVAVLAVVALGFAAFFLVPWGGKDAPNLSQLEEAFSAQRSQLLKPGQTMQLEIPKSLRDQTLTFASGNEQVATVDQAGLVTAKGAGMTFITVSLGEDQALCGIYVPGEGTLIDVTKLTAKEVFSDLLLHSVTEITGMAVDSGTDTVYLAQPYGTSSFIPLNADTIVSRVEKKDGSWSLGSRMRFTGSGKGYISLAQGADKTRLWVENGGDYIGYGKGLALVDWVDGGYCEGDFGTGYEMQGISGGLSFTVDAASGTVVVYDRAEKCYRVYNGADMLSGDQAPQWVYTFSVKANQTPANGIDDSKGRYNASVRGYGFHDGYLYQFSGSTSIYLSVFDMEGKLQYCTRLPGREGAGYYAPAAIAFSEGKLYVAIASGNSEYNLANVLVFE